jgi:ring-1,2-phenylacetyl-CoA epoxidase subunit PaaE
MMAKFFRLKIAEVTRETAESVSVLFEVPEDIKDNFKFVQGQYVTLKLNVNGEELRRSYSICSSPVLNEGLRVAVKKVQGGRVSGYINDKLKAGEEMEVMVPMGNFFTKMDPVHKKKYVLFAGGSGITPMISILKTVLVKEPMSSVLMFYGNQNEDAIIFKSQLDELEKKYAGKLKIYHVLNEPQKEENKIDVLFTGIMLPEKVTALVQKYVDLKDDNEFFICGPSPMMANVVESLKLLNAPEQKVHVEYFSAPPDTSESVGIEQPMGNSTFSSEVTIVCDGDETTLTLGADEVILDAALAANIDAPYACRGGSCCTCRAKVIEGKVIMKVNYALLESEVEQGYILTCQSMPITPTVVVDYDQGI